MTSTASQHIMKTKLFISAILAGISIGFGGLIFLCLENKILGSALFSVGLFTVCTFGFDLFTGKICYFTERSGSRLLDMIIIWFGNLIGTGLIAGLTHATRLRSTGIVEKARTICETKVNDSPVSLILLGIVCNVFIYIAVENYKSNPHKQGKYLAIVAAVMGFILVGSEHCVADMFYLFVADLFFVDSIKVLFFVTIGNIIGGITFRLMHQYAKEGI